MTAWASGLLAPLDQGMAAGIILLLSATLSGGAEGEGRGIEPIQSAGVYSYGDVSRRADRSRSIAGRDR